MQQVLTYEEPQLERQPTPLSAVDIEHEDFEWTAGLLDLSAAEMAPRQIAVCVPMYTSNLGLGMQALLSWGCASDTECAPRVGVR